MLKQIDISYNPFVPLMKILIDGSEIDDFSQLISYINEPIWEIKNKFFHIKIFFRPPVSTRTVFIHEA